MALEPGELKAQQIPLPIRDKRLRHWFWVQDDIVDQYGWLLGAQGLAVYMVLARHADRDDQKTKISLEKIAEKADISLRSVKNQIKHLEKLELIQVYRPGRRMVNEYLLLEPKSISAVLGSALPQKGSVQAQDTLESALPIEGSVQVQGLEAPGAPIRGNIGQNAPLLIDDDISIPIDQHYQQQIEKGAPGARIDSEVKNIYSRLTSMGVDPLVARDLAGSTTLDCVDAWVDYMGSHYDKRLGPGFLVQRLKAGVYPPGHKGGKDDCSRSAAETRRF